MHRVLLVGILVGVTGLLTESVLFQIEDLTVFGVGHYCASVHQSVWFAILTHS